MQMFLYDYAALIRLSGTPLTPVSIRKSYLQLKQRFRYYTAHYGSLRTSVT